MSEIDLIEDTVNWFQEAVRSPTSRNKHTQLGVHFEEVAEMLAELKGTDQITRTLLMDAMFCLKSLALHLKTNNDVVTISDPHNMLKELCDQIVTSVGVGHMYGYDMTAAMDEVNQSNWSKFVDGKPVFDKNHKIQKGPDYFKANLSAFIPTDS